MSKALKSVKMSALLIFLIVQCFIANGQVVRYEKGFIHKEDFSILKTTTAKLGSPQCSMKCTAKRTKCLGYVYDEVDNSCILGTFHPKDLICPLDGQFPDIYSK